MSTAQVIPFQFETREVRTMLIDDQPWFCATDVCAVLGYANGRKAIADNCREAGVTASDISSGGQKRRVTFISEGNLYRLIIKSRKAEAQRFESWVCDEVLPMIRRSGRYEDANNKMATLVDELIGMSEVNVIKGLIRGKANVVPIDKRRSFQQSMHNRLHTRFNVPRIELIPAAQFEVACNFVAAYALEGEWIAQADEPAAPSASCWSSIGVMAACLEESYAVFEKRRLYAHLDGLGSPAGGELLGLLWDGLGAARHVKRLCAEQLARR
jgi:prophage antirepressor-like protein